MSSPSSTKASKPVSVLWRFGSNTRLSSHTTDLSQHKSSLSSSIKTPPPKKCPGRQGRTLSETDTISNATSCKLCNCRNSKCLKLYCECFSGQRYCSGICSCHNCMNRPEFEPARAKAIADTLRRKPHAFSCKFTAIRSTSSSTSGDKTHIRGCNCKKTGCLKGYCECFQNNVKCSDKCRCVDCKNALISVNVSPNLTLDVSREGIDPACDAYTHTTTTTNFDSKRSVNSHVKQASLLAIDSHPTSPTIKRKSSVLSRLLQVPVIENLAVSLVCAVEGEQQKTDQQGAEDLLLLINTVDKSSSSSHTRKKRRVNSQFPSIQCPKSPQTQALLCNESEDIVCALNQNKVTGSRPYRRQEHLVLDVVDQFLKDILAVAHRKGPNLMETAKKQSNFETRNCM